MNISTFLNCDRMKIVRVFHSGAYAEGAQIISADDDSLGRKPAELNVPQLNALLQYWRDLGEDVTWCASASQLRHMLHRSTLSSGLTW